MADADKAANWKISEDGRHVWLVSHTGALVGLHNDQVGTWLDLRSAYAENYPELALAVPKNGGAPKLQVSNGRDLPVSIDLLELATMLQLVLNSRIANNELDTE